MKRDGDHLWQIVTATVRPLAARADPLPLADASRFPPRGKTGSAPPPPSSSPSGGSDSRPARAIGGQRPRPPRPPDPIEPNRFHRLARGHAPTIDLHNLNQDRARAALTAFILRAHAEGARTVLVITGKGALGDGILRRRTPEWLAEPPLRPLIAGLSEAHRKHGGEGALYVALKRGGR
jgi:DNA-nicking Smr family endonuclease